MGIPSRSSKLAFFSILLILVGSSGEENEVFSKIFVQK